MIDAMELKIKKLIPDLDLRYHSDGASGIDIPVPNNVFLIDGECKTIKCGFCVEIPKGYEGQIRPRSGWSSAGVDVTFGTIDSDYRGEVNITVKLSPLIHGNELTRAFNNLGQITVCLNKGDRIAQLVICPVQRCKIEFVDELLTTKRGEGGFGSTGK